MISDSATLILFAIRSALKLNQQLRLAYVENTRRRELVLPLPNFFNHPDAISAANYFAGPGARYASSSSRIQALLARRVTPGLSTEEETELLTAHTECFNLDLANRGQLGATAEGYTLSGAELTALITIRQWRRGDDPQPSVLHRVAGSLIEIGVDYFANVPGALNPNSRQGRVATAFLQGLDGLSFTETQLRDLPGRLFVGTLETLSSHPDWVTADPHFQELVKVTTHSLSGDVARRLTALQAGGSDLVKEQRVVDWAEAVFASLLSSGGRLVVSDPGRFLGVHDPARGALVSKVGNAVLGLALDEDGLELDRLLGRQGLEAVLQASLAVVGEHPEILPGSDHAPLQQLLGQMAKELAGFDTLLTPDILPELLRLVLSKTGENLALFWPGFAGKPGGHLLLTGVRTALEEITRAPEPGARWQVQFTRTETLAVLDAVVAELAANPAWLLDSAGRVDARLRDAVSAALAVLRRQGDQRLSPALAIEILHQALLAVGLRQEFLERIPGVDPATSRTLLEAALDVVLAAVFGQPAEAAAAWQLARVEAAGALVRIALAQLARVRINPAALRVLAAEVEALVAALNDGGAWNPVAFEAALGGALGAALAAEAVPAASSTTPRRTVRGRSRRPSP